jgi:FAD/FMN-containing dehydrogenase
MNAPNDATPGAAGVPRLLAELGDIPHSTDPTTLVEKSRDYFWFSPILKEELEGLTAEVVVAPRDQAEVRHVAALCAKHRVPITARGLGTGNFGQAVPLAGGLVLDMTGLDRMVWMRGASARAEAGIVCRAFDEATRPTGFELRMHPSTKRIATLGGFMSGGHAGIGSVTYGILRDRGNILGLKLVTIEETPRELEIRGDRLAWVHHAYGVNGIITEVEMPLAPAFAWRDVVIAFDDFMRAARFGWALATSDGIARKLVSPVCARLAAHFGGLSERIPAGADVVIAMVAPESMDALGDLVAEFGGRIVLDVPEGGWQDTPLYEYTWGHTTLQVLKNDPSVTYLICIFQGDDPLEQVRRVHERYGDEVPLHLEMKRINGRMAVEGLPVFRYAGAEHMARLYAALEAEGVKIANGHTYFLQNGGMKTIDESQLRFKRSTDPYNLMNPGKVAGFDQIAGADGGLAEARASGWAY